MGEIRTQRCEYCGEELGHFAHSRRHDGPLACSAPECSRQAANDERDDARDEQESARFAAEQDGYSLYGGRY